VKRFAFSPLQLVKLFSKHFGIESSRISTKGQSKPNIPSKQPGGTPN
jgi:hypothetical protein